MYKIDNVKVDTACLVALLDSRHQSVTAGQARVMATVKQWRTRRGHSRRGLTLIEVLMSIFVMAIGLFGVAALLPLGQKKMIEGAIDQRKAQVAESAFEYLGNQGGLNPSRWIDATGATYDAVRISPVGRVLCAVATGSNASSIVTTSPNLTAPSNAYNDSVIEFRTGRLRGLRRVVGTYTANGATKTFTTTTALPADPSPGDASTPPDTFVVIRAKPFAIDPQLVAKLGAAAGDFALACRA